MSHLRILAFALAVLAVPAVPAVLAAQTDSSASPTVLPDRSASGAFSVGQVEKGEGVFNSYCASCHAPTFHTGEQFRFSWFGRTVLDYFKVVKSTMPEDNPGALSDDDYTRVIAYILKLNGFAPGADSLTSDTLELKRIRISEPSGSP